MLYRKYQCFLEECRNDFGEGLTIWADLMLKSGEIWCKKFLKLYIKYIIGIGKKDVMQESEQKIANGMKK